MKKNTCLTLILLLCTLICGCQTGPTDEELINTTMNTWKQAAIAQDVDAFMAVYSEDFAGSNGEDKEQVREVMEDAFDQGYLDNVDINLDIAQLTITDDIAEFSPVDIVADMGEITVDFTLKKEDKNTWRIIESVDQ
ncbi:MAG: nuclear transport factor 2 family protein [Planctomycetota bacterium]|jgi:ketosteroid isomerase-like protein